MSSATTVAAVQMRAVPRDVAGNLARADQFLEQASARGAELAVFPELFNVAWQRGRRRHGEQGVVPSGHAHRLTIS